MYWLLIFFPFVLSACSVGMAASGHKEQDASIIFPGSNRAVIISKLGAPETSRRLDDGRTADSYLIKKGNETSSGRAWAHAGLDLFTLGAWEIIATPYELAQSEERTRVVIIYDTAGTVVDVQQAGGQIPENSPKAPPAVASTSVETPLPQAPSALPSSPDSPSSAPPAPTATRPPAPFPSVPPQATPPIPPSGSNATSAADTQLRNAEREFRAGRMSLEEFRQIKKVLQAGE